MSSDAASLTKAWARGLKPPADLTISQWADHYRLLPKGSAEPGPYRTDRTPFWREPMDVLSSHSRVKEVYIMKASQMGATEAGVLNPIGYYVHYDPSEILVVWAGEKMVDKNSKTRIDPMIESTPVIRDTIVKKRTLEGGNTTRLKLFPGGSLNVGNAGSITDLISSPKRIAIGDEIDEWPDDLNGRGDPWTLLLKRLRTYPNAKAVAVSKPSVKGRSKIEAGYLWRSGEIHEDILMLTAGADVQENRIEVEVIGWGKRFEHWSVEYHVITADTTTNNLSDRCWTELAALMAKQWSHPNGDNLYLSGICIDAGYNTETVYHFCRGYPQDRVLAIQGSDRLKAPISRAKAVDHIGGKHMRNALFHYEVGSSFLKC